MDHGGDKRSFFLGKGVSGDPTRSLVKKTEDPMAADNGKLFFYIDQNKEEQDLT